MQCSKCGQRERLAAPDALEGHHYRSDHLCSEGGSARRSAESSTPSPALLRMIWTEGPHLSEVYAQICEPAWTRQGSSPEAIHAQTPSGERVVLVRHLAAETLLLAVAHHTIDVLEDPKEAVLWLEEVRGRGPAADELMRTWQTRERPTPSLVAATAARLLADDVTDRGAGGAGWAATCWIHSGAHYRAAAEMVLA